MAVAVACSATARARSFALTDYYDAGHGGFDASALIPGLALATSTSAAGQVVVVAGPATGIGRTGIGATHLVTVAPTVRYA